jgi:hypothetical protein
MNRLKILLMILFYCVFNPAFAGGDTLRIMKYSGRQVDEAVKWQDHVRAGLFNLLRLDELRSMREGLALNPGELASEDRGAYLLREVEINSTPGRRIRVIVTIPKNAPGSCPAVVCIHGHGGTSRVVYEKGSIYKGFADTLAALNFVTIAPFVSQHKVFEEGRLLMGERLWDLIRCVDYLAAMPMVDHTRIGCAGLSLGGEMAMWLGAMDQRIQATVSSGFLTKMDQMEQNHCMCWKFPGLRQLVDYADIYSLVAPRPLQCQNGIKEPARDFSVPVAREALKEIEVIYKDYQRPENLSFDVHEGAHEIDLPGLLSFFGKHLAH